MFLKALLNAGRGGVEMPLEGQSCHQSFLRHGMLQILYSGMSLLQPGTAGIPWWKLESLKAACRMYHLERASPFCFCSAPLVTNPSSG